MKNIKQFFTYLVVGALVMALSISCKTDDGPTETGSTTQGHPSQGSYTSTIDGTSATVTVNDDGTCSIRGKARYESEYQDFDITITTWYYSFSRFNDYYAGSSYEQSEATINSPIGVVDFGVLYDFESKMLRIWFGPSGKRYAASGLSRQQ